MKDYEKIVTPSENEIKTTGTDYFTIENLSLFEIKPKKYIFSQNRDERFRFKERLRHTHTEIYT